MAPELRKRKAPPPAPEPPAKKTSKVSKAVAKVKETVTGKPDAAEKANGASKAAAKPVVGNVITLDGFGGEIETNNGEKTTLKALVAESKSGVVLFTYPKASTPGCKYLDFSFAFHTCTTHVRCYFPSCVSLCAACPSVSYI